MVKEFVTYWGPSLNDWGEKQERHVIERDEELLKDGHVTGGRRLKKISLNEIFEDGVVTDENVGWLDGLIGITYGLGQFPGGRTWFPLRRHRPQVQLVQNLLPGLQSLDVGELRTE